MRNLQTSVETGEREETMSITADQVLDCRGLALSPGISREEFEQLRKDLEASNTHAHEADSHGGHSHGHCGH